MLVMQMKVISLFFFFFLSRTDHILDKVGTVGPIANG